jgi:hypothetical protein
MSICLRYNRWEPGKILAPLLDLHSRITLYCKIGNCCARMGLGSAASRLMQLELQSVQEKVGVRQQELLKTFQ